MASESSADLTNTSTSSDSSTTTSKVSIKAIRLLVAPRIGRRVFFFLNCFQVSCAAGLPDMIEVSSFYHRQWAPDYPELVTFRYDGITYQIRLRQHRGKVYFAEGLDEFKKYLSIFESRLPNCVMPHVNVCGRHMTILWRFGPPLQWNVVVVDGGVGHKYVGIALTPGLTPISTQPRQAWLHIHPRLQARGYGKRQQWKITMHDGVPSVAQPWFQYLSKINLMPGDEVIFFFRFDEHVWEVVFRKEVIREDEDLSR
ncbi:hypothetical protein JHK85_043673 [Glycine max]|nr:hypothetical protein JHK85_043673 [Glycine max]